LNQFVNVVYITNVDSTAAPRAFSQPVYSAIIEEFYLNRPRVLLVDDTPEILALCAEILKPHCEIVDTAPDGKSAIAAFKMTTPDVVVLDVSMPGLNGVEVARQLRTFASGSAIVFLSADMEFTAAAMQAGGSAFVKKTLITSDLWIAIQEALAGRRFVSASD
jgi:two-component system response regulator AlgR